MKKNYLLLALCMLAFAFNSQAQVSRWYGYHDYDNNQAIGFGEDIGFSTLVLWNDTTAKYGVNPGAPAYYKTNIVSAGLSFNPRMSSWDDPTYYGSSIKVGSGDTYTIDSVAIYGIYLRNNLKTAVKDTLKLSFIYGDGSSGSNIVTQGTSSIHYGSLTFIDLTYDSIKNIAGKTLSAPAPYVQNIILSNTDTASLFIKSFKLTTPFTVPAGQVAAMSMTFKSGDPTFVANDTIFDASGKYKYGAFTPYIQFYTTSSGGPIDFRPFFPADSNMGFYEDKVSSTRGWAGQYVPEWAWSTSGGGPSFLQIPVADFHVTCSTCDLNDTMTGISTMCAGTTFPFNVDYTGGAWSSSNTAVATVTSGGVVGAVAPGIATIKYLLSGHKTTFTVTVITTPTPTSIIGASFLCTGGSSLYSDFTSGGTWSSSVPAVATIGSGGTAIPLSAGTTTISYTLTDGCGSKSAITTLTVETTPAPAPIAGSSTVCVGGTVTLSDATSGGTWSATGDATISSSGTVTGVSKGSATVSYVVSNSCGTSANSRTITVDDVPDAGSIAGLNTLCIGDHTTLTETVPTGGSWSSATGNLLVVSSTIGGLSAGVDTVKYTVTNTCGTNIALFVVTVKDCRTSVNNIQAADNVTIHPNPAQDQLFISATTIINKVEVTNVAGQTVIAQQFSDKNVAVSVAHLPAGTYIVKINDGNTYKVIKQ